jgi:hypothetical protein
MDAELEDLSEQEREEVKGDAPLKIKLDALR